VAVDSLYQLGKDQNGIYAISHSNGALNVINMSGIKTTVSIGNFNDKPKIFSSNSGISILFKKQKSLYCFDLKGKRKWMQNFSLNEITESYLYENEMGKIQLIILDGIENELYLLNQNGKLMDVSSKHGEQKVDISGFGSRGFSITTYLGNYLIQYNK
jgi:outer membrane protein assembly factor BamB